MEHRIFFNPIKFSLPWVYLTTCKVPSIIYGTQSCSAPLEHLKTDREENRDSFTKSANQELRKSSQTIQSHEHSDRISDDFDK